MGDVKEVAVDSPSTGELICRNVSVRKWFFFVKSRRPYSKTTFLYGRINGGVIRVCSKVIKTLKKKDIALSRVKLKQSFAVQLVGKRKAD